MSNSDETKKNEQNPDFLWDLDSLNRELAEEFQKASAGLLKDLNSLQEQMLKKLEEEDEE